MRLRYSERPNVASVQTDARAERPGSAPSDVTATLRLCKAALEAPIDSRDAQALTIDTTGTTLPSDLGDRQRPPQDAP